MSQIIRNHGRIALVGSGEYLPAMSEFERELLDLGGSDLFIQIPTAAGQESSSRLEFWRELGAEQAKRIGAKQVFLPIYTREDAFNNEFADQINDAGLIYLSGGDPHYLASSLIDTPVYDAIKKNWQRGASLAALQMIEPDTLVSFHAGANDVIRPKYRAEITLPEYAKAVRELAAELNKNGARLMLFTVQESAAANTRTGVIWNERFKEFNKQVRELAKETNAILNEANDGRYPNDIRFLAFDRLHLNPEGHHRVAQGVLENMGLPFDAGYKIPLPPTKKENPIKKKIVNAIWIITFVLPWIYRRLRGISSGDGRIAKYPSLISWPISDNR